MDLAQLRIFQAVVQEGGVTKAADRLNRVQSNVTTRVRQLEDQLGVALFTREGKRLVLTSAGRTLIDYADRILALAAEAEAAVHDDKPRGVFRLGAMESTAAVRLPSVLGQYATDFPEVAIELKTGNPVQLSADVLAGNLDAALVAEPVAAACFDTAQAFSEVPVLVTNANHPPVGPGHSVPKSIIVFESGCPHRRALDEWFAHRDDLPERTIEIGSYHAMLGCVMAGMGAALVPQSVVATFPDQARLKCHSLYDDTEQMRTLLIWKKSQVTPKVKALADLLA